MKSARLCTLLVSLIAVPVLAQVADPDAEDAPYCPTPLYRPAVPYDPGAAKVTEGINRFSLDLYKASIRPPNNLLISPASVSTAAGLAYRGTTGKTAGELKATIHYFADPEAYAPANGSLLKRLNYQWGSNRLVVANSLWLQDGMPLRADSVADMGTYYDAGLQLVDYLADPDVARRQINAWAEKQTNQKISGLLEPSDITADTRAALVNTISWKGGWQKPFERSLTKIEPFTRFDGRKVNTALMHLRSNFSIVERDGVRAIALHYENYDAEMIVLMPKSARGLSRFENKLTADELAEWIVALDDIESRDTILTFPRIRIDWRNDLKGALKDLGISSRLDLSGIAGIAEPGKADGAADSTIAYVIHEAIFEVDELGSAAAAVPPVCHEIAIAPSKKPPPPYIFRANKPFMFLLRDLRTKTILFMGRYVAPPG